MTVASDALYLAQHIRDALASGPTAELGVEVHVDEVEVTLAGSVGTEEQREQLAEIAAPLAGGRAIRNDVVVVHGVADPQPEAL
jgi:osmotically-inducible protein OsmY